ncbi:amino acid adenylation domain-containing protein [Amycolatopsis minnesotensis]|uniref:Non-ribosomal peptide synthetase DhbF n=1 Tax=Amycolatopsis minnesotensis TaxID=337894 RepID=A0ABP5DDF1_9PSEU
MKRAGTSQFLPLSPLQKGLLFHAELTGEDAGVDVYALQVVADLHGPLDVPVLHAAARSLLRRHDNLRACFRRRKNGDPVQVVPASVELPLAEHDLTGLAPAERAAELDRLTDDDRRKRFDPARPPLMRFTVLRTGEAEFRLLWTVHHILADGWSMPILTKELLAAYGAGGEIDDAAMPAPRPYREHLGWLAKQDERVALNAWHTAMAGLDEPTRVAPSVTDPVREVPESVAVTVSRELTAIVTESARERGLTLNTVAQGCWALALGLLTGRRDIVFGGVSSARPAELDGVEDMVGMFANTLPVRVPLDPGKSVVDTLHDLQRRQFDLLDHQHVGLAEVQRQAGIGELFDTALMFQNYPAPAGIDYPGGLRLVAADIRAATGYPLSLTVLPGDRIELRAQYRGDVFARHEVEHVLTLVQRLLRLVSTEPGTLVGRVDVTDDAERAENRLRAGFDTGLDLPDELLPALLAHRAATDAERVALVCGDTVLTYAQLRARVEALTADLVAGGAGPEQVVAIALPRSADLVVAAVAVLSSGAAYLPIDPDHPSDRVGYMFDDAKPALLVTTTEVAAGLGAAANLPALLLDAPDAPKPVREAAPAEALTGDHPCYVIYTSGSTGRPKGVVVRHHGLLNLVVDMAARLRVSEEDRLLAVTTFGFDIANLELFVPLLAGATLVVAEREVVREPAKLAAMIRDIDATVIQATPSQWQSVLAAGKPDLTGRRVLVGGEALSEPLAADLLAAGAEVVNLYGPTETTIWSTSDIVDGSRAGAPSIGRPIANTQMHILDPMLRPVRPGCPGELYIGGDALARGYHGRTGLTSNRFVADPFGRHGSRIYRTGDVAMWGPDGKIDYLGRVDHQVKVRGFRIELGEIEAVLSDHPRVLHAAAVARDHGGGDVRLVGYVVPESGADVDPAELRAHLGETLPEYMVPAVLVTMDAFPMTPSGKIDRGALPEPELATVDGRAARTPEESRLAGLFAEVLGISSVGIDEDFFALGGHSLLATRLTGRIRAELGTEVPVRTLFDTPTVAGLAALLDTGGQARPALVGAPASAEPELSAAQQRLWFFNQLGDMHGTYNIPLAVRLTGEPDVDALGAALGDLATRHDVLRTVFPSVDGRPYPAVRDASVGKPPLFVTSVRPGELADELASAARHGFDLGQELPVRAHLFHCGQSDYVLLLVLHHVIADGWSIAPLANDLATAYTARHSGRAPEWTPLPVRYADYVHWQAELLGAEDDPESVQSKQLEFWRTTLAELPEELALPADFARPPSASHRGDSVALTLPAELRERIEALAREGAATPFMVVQAALAALLGKLGAGTDIPIGTAIAGRTDSALDELVGLFVNTVVLRTDLSGDPTFRTLLGRVRETDLAAYANQDLPYERVVAELNPARSLARQALVQVALAFQNYRQGRLGLPGLAVAPERIPSYSAKFDLSLELEEDADGALQGVLEFNTDLFRRDSAERIASRFALLLDAAVRTPDEPLSRLDALDGDERDKLLRQWCGPVAPARPAVLPALFETHAAARPGADAVVARAGTMTFGELNAEANRLARLLVAHGAGPERFVAVAMPRSADLVVGILGVLKAGAAFLPIDPAHPEERLRHVLTDAKPALVLGAGPGVDSLPDTGIPVLRLDDPAVAGVLADLPSRDLTDAERTEPLTPSHPAYAIYTSGSTGKPKGVIVQHASVADMIAALGTTLGAHTGTRMLQFAAHSFDAVVAEIGGSVFVGGALAIAEEGDRGGQPLADLIGELDVNLAILPPVVLSTMPAESSFPEELVLTVAGEACSPEVVARWSARHRMHNLYGPTEVTIWASASDPLTPGGTPPIGRPVANQRLRVLDTRLSPVGIGVVGELYVGGGLARGYLGRTDLTAQRFVADPFGGTGERVYRTGDLVRWLPDGNLDFVGRVDNQVKIRGFRIELGDIEDAVRSHPSVASAVAIVREDRPGDRRVVAYVRGDVAPEPVRAHAATRLPAYMVPSAVVVLDEFPTTRHGKIDHTALPAPETETGGTRAPRTPAERVLCDVVADVLGLPEAGVDLDFFAAGGNSIQSIQVVDKAGKAGIRLSVADLFTHPRIEDLAAASEVSADAGWATADPLAVLLPIRTGGDLPPLFCVHSGLGTCLPYLGLAEHIGRARPIYGLQAPYVTSSAAPPEDMAALAAEYVERLRTVQPSGPYHLFGWSFGGLLAHEMAVQLEEAGETVALLANVDSFPVDERDDEVDDAELLLRLLETAGYDRTEFPDDRLALDEICDLLASDGGLFAALGRERIPRLVSAMKQHAKLACAMEYREFSGAMRLFVATAGLAEAEIDDRVRRWAPHVGGEISTHLVACDHDHLMHPGARRTIGREIAAALDDSTDTEEIGS